MRISAPVLTVVLSTSFPVIADVNNDVFNPRNFSGDLALGSLSGNTKERVYDADSGGRKISQLNWKYNNAAIVKGSLDWELIPWLSIGASGWTTIASRGGYMDDTDWEDENKNSWTDQSKHPNTRLNFANEFDLNVKGWLLNEPNYRLGMMAGYQESRYSFKSNGGTYNYTNEETGLPDVGSFPAGKTVIGYKQRFKMPYIGILASYRYDRFELGGSFKYSGWVRATDVDEHYESDKTFKANIKNQNYYSLVGNVGYYITPDTKLYLEGAWNHVANKKGSLYINDYGKGKTETAQNSSGIESSSFMTTVGLKHSF